MSAPPAPPGPITGVRAVAVRPGRHLEVPEQVATEEPLEIRACGPGQAPVAVAVTMRTPGQDFDLAVGFLLTEGLLRPDDVAAVGYCDVASEDRRWNTVTVSVRSRWRPPPSFRLTTSACGVCAKTSIEQVALDCAPVAPTGDPLPAVVDASLLARLPDHLGDEQRVFARTGGLHAAGVFDRHGAVAVVREDVGRHNAVDKVVGSLALHSDRRPDPAILVVSGRVSFEIVQKAAMAGVAVLAAVSAPSSMAVTAADRLGVTLAAFVRNGQFNVYSHPGRIALDA